jgi:DNA polymerase III subunit delta'
MTAVAPFDAWDGLVGHEAVRNRFRQMWVSGRWPQSLLLVGPDGIGKFEFARRLAMGLLCQQPVSALTACGSCSSCRPFLAGAHPDYLLLERDAGKRELTIDKLLGSREQRGKSGLCHDLSMRPLPGSRKVAIIRDADLLNDEAGNALLKTLEEPPEGAILILLAANLDAVLPTLRSRCQIVRLSPLTSAEVATLLQRLGWVTEPQEAVDVAALSQGSLTSARALLSPQLRQLRDQLWDSLAQPGPLPGQQVARSLQESLDAISTEVSEQRVAVAWLLQMGAEFFLSALRAAVSSTSPAAPPRAVGEWLQRRSWQAREDLADAVGAAVERCHRAVLDLDQNVAVNLCLAAWLHDLSNMCPSAPATAAVAKPAAGRRP